MFLTIDGLRHHFRTDIQDEGVDVVPSYGTDADDFNVASNLLDHLHEPNYSVPGSIHNLTSSSLTAALPGGTKSLQSWHVDGILEVTPFIVST